MYCWSINYHCYKFHDISRCRYIWGNLTKGDMMSLALQRLLPIPSAQSTVKHMFLSGISCFLLCGLMEACIWQIPSEKSIWSVIHFRQIEPILYRLSRDFLRYVWLKSSCVQVSFYSYSFIIFNSFKKTT